MARNVFKKFEHFYINEIDGVIFEWRTEKKSAKNCEYFTNIFSYLYGIGFTGLAFQYSLMFTVVLSMDNLTNL